MTMREYQELIGAIYFEKDSARGVDGTFMWLVEEVGELSRALRRGTREQQAEEFADVLAWLATLANLKGIDLAEVSAGRYGSGCPKCGQTPCDCH